MSSGRNRTALLFALLGWQVCMAGSFAATPTAASSSTTTGGGDSLPANLAPTADDTDVPDPVNFMTLLDKVGVGKKMDDLGLDIYGHVEGGYTYQFLQPNDQIASRTYDFVSNEAILNQAAVNIERLIPVTHSHFDIGFRAELLEGTDAQFTRSFRSRQGYNGRPSASDYLFDTGGNNSTYQFDIPNAYVDVSIPLGQGLRLRAGRFEFFKPIDPNDRIFYSTTFAYNHAMPFTNTGATAAYDFSEHAGIEAGFSRGYNVTVDDNNGAIDFLGKLHFGTDRASLVATTEIGPQLTQDSRAYTALVDLAGSVRLSKAVSFLVDGIYSHQFGSSNTSQLLDPIPAQIALGEQPTGHLPASYYGVSGDVVWQVNRYFSLAGRLEWLRNDGDLLAAERLSLYEATIGTTITPFPTSALGQNLKVRPEVRYDYCTTPFFGPDQAFGGAVTRRDQLTVATDIIYNF